MKAHRDQKKAWNDWSLCTDHLKGQQKNGYKKLKTDITGNDKGKLISRISRYCLHDDDETDV